jgi:hypothetical protein
MLDELAALGLRAPLALADRLYGQNVSFRHGLEDRHVPRLLASPPHQTPAALPKLRTTLHDPEPDRSRTMTKL